MKLLGVAGRSGLSLLMAAAMTSSLAAQGRPADPSWQMDREVEARRIMHDFAACVAKYSQRGVDKFLATFPGTDEAVKAALEIATVECLRDGQLRFDSSLLRGSLYEILYQDNFRGDQTADFSSVPPIDYTSGRVLKDDEERMQVGLRQFSDCIVRLDPETSRTLILSNAEDGEEGGAFATLTPHFGACLSAGSELSFSKTVLRSLIAESLYRLSAAPKVATKALE